MSLERALFPNMEACLADEVDVANYCFAQVAASTAYSDFAARRIHLKATKETKHVEVGAKPSKSTIKDIISALIYAATDFPTRVFLRFGDQDVTFQDFDIILGKVAGGPKQAGIGPGDRILGMMLNSLEMESCWFATNQLGGISVPVNTELESVTLNNVIQAVEPKLAIIYEELWPILQSLGVLNLESVFINGQHNFKHSTQKFSTLTSSRNVVCEPIAVPPAITAAFLYTGGTTGKLKPFAPALILGAVGAISVRFSVSRFWDEIRVVRATVHGFMGATLTLLYKQPPNETEITMSALRGAFLYQDSHRITRSVSDTHCYFQYFNNHASTAAVFADLWLQIVDLAPVDEQGNVYFVGRVKDIIRRRGENVNDAEVEEEFLQHPDVIAAAAYAIPSQLGLGAEEDVKVAVELRAASVVNERDLWEWAVERMATSA
ncbi:putative long-chain-fatty-acid-- ligase protein [Paramyrothecium foliicola]|nr:putative long-chain-fatty-acid-- ligase protein [Paramyrothecium foliicola]